MPQAEEETAPIAVDEAVGSVQAVAAVEAAAEEDAGGVPVLPVREKRTQVVGVFCPSPYRSNVNASNVASIFQQSPYRP